MTVSAVPGPAAVTVWTPIRAQGIGNPHISAVSGIVAPASMAGKLVLVILISSLQVAGSALAGISQASIPFMMPEIEIVFIGRTQVKRGSCQIAAGHDQLLSFTQSSCDSFSGNFKQAVDNHYFSVAVAVDVNAVNTPAEQEDTAIGRLYLDVALEIEIADVKVNPAPVQAQERICFTQLGQAFKGYQGVVVKSQVIDATQV